VHQHVEGLYPWPFDGQLYKENTALLIIDMQVDFCGENGWYDQLGIDRQPFLAIVPPLKSLLKLMRYAGFPIFFTRESHRPDLTDLNPTKAWRSQQRGIGIGELGLQGKILVRGEPGCEMIPDLAPKPGEAIIDKPGASAFYATDLEQLLRRRNIRNLILTGITTDGAVQSTLRDANDRGYECLLLSDCCASDVPAHHAAQIHVLSLSDGLYGSITESRMLMTAIQSAYLEPV
jgi:nicotinamidase-related amidase